MDFTPGRKRSTLGVTADKSRFVADMVCPQIMRYLSLACDYDRTLADEGTVAPATLAAIGRLKASGRTPILVTGRQVDDLQHVFPELDAFDRVVAENGAVLYTPASQEQKALADPPLPEFLDALRLHNVKPLSVGRVIVATEEPYDTAVLAAIKELGLELQVIYNRESVMVLPSGINKATGLQAALSELRISTHQTIGIGDGENDHSLLHACGLGVAVANAVPSLKEEADLVTRQESGKGVEELIDRLLLNDLADVEPHRNPAKTAGAMHQRG